jgi:hypothetical protein
MQVEIYVITTEIVDIIRDNNAMSQLMDIKDEISQKCEGITVLPMKYGEWWNSGMKCTDIGEIWRILSDNSKPIDFQWLKTKIDEIKAVTKQQSQLYTVNRNCVPYYR